MAAAQDNGSFQSSPWPGEGRRKAPASHPQYHRLLPKGQNHKKGGHEIWVISRCFYAIPNCLEIQYSLGICSKEPALGRLRTILAVAIFFPTKRQNILTYVRQRSVFAKFVLQLEKELVRRCGMCA